MRRFIQTALVLMMATVVGRAEVFAQDFSWSGQLGRGQSLEIKGINGEIKAVLASGDQVRVRAEKVEGRRGDPDDVTVEVVEHNGGITICAVYPSRDNDEPNECAAGSGGRMNTRNNDTRVDFTVEVPAGVALVARTVNGDVTAEGLSGEVRAFTVNGDVDVATSAMASANTVNGNITVRMSGNSLSDDLDFETVNGSITVELDGAVNADVSAGTVNGGISTDFPLTVSGRFGPKRINGTIGNGGAKLSMTTVNGRIEIRRR